ncbi:hypothetical protein DICVIV_06376 [Dictyocaulus viviparus]|uniref:Uncharacterized protein n=1 Tax=Dictyocaulus viviparus TaxID=29172 RepID=A0A0D8XSM3_DICVI|nr:hypothetical protein DICVIV_06376 [Dictyocaulus viviparus]
MRHAISSARNCKAFGPGMIRSDNILTEPFTATLKNTVGNLEWDDMEHGNLLVLDYSTGKLWILLSGVKGVRRLKEVRLENPLNSQEALGISATRARKNVSKAEKTAFKNESKDEKKKLTERKRV